jgi:hypothetical protein
MFAAWHSGINSLKHRFIHLTGQPNSQKGGAKQVKDGIISDIKFLVTILLIDTITTVKGFRTQAPEAVFLVVCDPSMNEL